MYVEICVMIATSKVTAPQDAHKRLVLHVAEWLTAGFKGGARHESKPGLAFFKYLYGC